MQARMQASYQGHIKEGQPAGQDLDSSGAAENLPQHPTGLEQENSILRDALNQAPSQVESKQNTEQAKAQIEA